MKLHQEFAIGVHDKNDLASFLSRCDTVLASVQNAANLAALKLKGWTDAETTAFQTARTAVGPAEQFRTQSIGGAKDTTTTKNTDAATLYENVLTIQNAADLEWPASNPGQRWCARRNFCSASSRPTTVATMHQRRPRPRRKRLQQNKNLR